MPKRTKLKYSIIIVGLLFLFITGCSNQLETENEKLRTELNTAMENLKEAELKLKELESKINISKDQANIIEDNESTNIKIVPPNHNANQLLLGEWFFQYFHEEPMNNWTQNLIFNSDGTGTIIRVFYLPKELIEQEYSTSNPSGEDSQEFSWSLDADTIHIVCQEQSFDITFLPEVQELHQTASNGKVSIYSREKFSIPDKYIEQSLLVKNIEAKKAILMRRFFGTWYFDVLTWTFNNDGTGFIDIPEIGEQPATKRDFSYSVTGDITNMVLMLEWSDSTTSYFWPEIKDDGSIIFKNKSDSDSMKLTRTFDVNNCPLSKNILENGIGVLSGSMFSDLLP